MNTVEKVADQLFAEPGISDAYVHKCIEKQEYEAKDGQGGSKQYATRVRTYYRVLIWRHGKEGEQQPFGESNRPTLQHAVREAFTLSKLSPPQWTGAITI